MGLRERYEPGTFCWADLATTDAAGAKEFYCGLFGWEAEDMPAGDGMTYTMLSKDGDDVCALYQGDPEYQPGMPYWLSYVSVGDAGEVASRAAGLGGRVLAEPFDVLEDVGCMALVGDPTGATLALWEPGRHKGARRVNDPGCMTWNELHTSRPEEAAAFYEGLLGWETDEQRQDGGDLAYVVVRNAGSANGGIMPAPGGADTIPAWVPYFTVDSCEEAARRAGELGGEVVAGPMEVGVGTIAVVRDPQGALFAVYEGETDD